MEREYPCSNDQRVIDLKPRRLTQMSRKQSQDDGDGRQGKTDVMRNQDSTRLVVAAVRKLVLSFAGARDQGGQHFSLNSGGACFQFFYIADSGIEEDEKGEESKATPYIISRGEKVVSQRSDAGAYGTWYRPVEDWNRSRRTRMGLIDLYSIVCYSRSPTRSAMLHQSVTS